MAKHNVHMSLPWREIGKVDVEFQIFKDGKLFGTITISKGSFEWYPKNAKNPYSIGWTELDKMIRKHKE